MQSAFDKTAGWKRTKALRLCGTSILMLLLGLTCAHANSTDFTGQFAAAFWTNQTQFGTVAFSNSSTELVVTGPNTPPAVGNSLDAILYKGSLGGGLSVGGTVEFHYSYNSGDALSGSDAEFSWIPPGGGSGDAVNNVLASGGPGTIVTGGFFSTPAPLLAGTTFSFSVFTDTPPPTGKIAPVLVITGFTFLDVPEPSSGALACSALACLGVARWRRSRQAASARQ